MATRVTPPTRGGRIARRMLQAKYYLDRKIWDLEEENIPIWERRLRKVLCIVSISLKGLGDNGIFSRAAGLSYGVMMAMGPMIAIAAWISSGFVHGDVETQIKNLLMFIAPSLQEYTNLTGVNGGETEMASALDGLIRQIVTGADALVEQVDTRGSRAFGTLGSVILIWLVIQLMTTIETTFNRIWGVRKGRAWGQRVVTYWSFISLGTVLGVGSQAMISASNLAVMFQWVPFGQTLTPLFFAITPLISFLMLVSLLCLFYMFFPNTEVKFRPALIGAAFTAFFLMANNYLSILYIHRVVSLQSLYGSLGIIPVLMIGLYFFWILILLGGQLTFSVQNVQFLTNQHTWRNLSPKARELLALATFLVIARRYLECSQPPTNDEIAVTLHAPVNTINESLTNLEDLGWASRVHLTHPDGSEWIGYQPAVPLDKLNLADFHNRIICTGNEQPLHELISKDPVIREYTQAHTSDQSHPFLRQSLKEILAFEEP